MLNRPKSTRFYTITTVGDDTIFHWHDKSGVFVGGIMLGILLIISFVKTFLDRQAPVYLFFVILIFTAALLSFLWFRNYWRIRVNKQMLTLYRSFAALTNTDGRTFPIAEISTISSRQAIGPADDSDPLYVVVMQLKNGKRIKIGNSIAHEESKALLEDLKPFVITGGELTEFKFSLSARLVAEIVVMIATGLLIGVAPSEDFDYTKSNAMKLALSLGGYSFMFYFISQQEHYEGKRVVLFIVGLAATFVMGYWLFGWNVIQVSEIL